MFDPTLGRWITEDPIGFEAGDENLYGFVGNNPVNETDSLGLQKKASPWKYELPANPFPIQPTDPNSGPFWPAPIVGNRAYDIEWLGLLKTTDDKGKPLGDAVISYFGVDVECKNGAPQIKGKAVAGYVRARNSHPLDIKVWQQYTTQLKGNTLTLTLNVIAKWDPSKTEAFEEASMTSIWTIECGKNCDKKHIKVTDQPDTNIRWGKTGIDPALYKEWMKIAFPPGPPPLPGKGPIRT